MALRRHTFALALLAGLGSLAGPSRAADEPDARALLDQVAAAYRALPAYGDKGEIRIAGAVDRAEKVQTKPLRMTFVRPNVLKVETDGVVAVCDGKTVTTTVAATKRFAAGPAPAVVTLDTFRAGPLGSVLFGGPTERLAFVLVNFLVGEEPVKALLTELDAKAQLDGHRETDGVRYTRLRLVTDRGPDYRLVIDRDSKLLAAVEVVLDPDEAEALPGESVALEHIEWRAGKLDRAAAKDEITGYKPPEGYTRVEPFETVVGARAEAAKHRVEDLLGQRAPDFSLTVLDAEGKFETVTRDDLTDKVVVLDFWATWCGPCLAELPELQKMVEGFAEDKKDVVVVALSQDQRPSELREVRALVEKTLGEKKIRLTGNAIAKIALDPSNAIGDAFQVEGYPTVVVLDRKGVVQAAHVGFRLDVRERLTRDVEALLEGKSLVEPKPQAKD